MALRDCKAAILPAEIPNMGPRIPSLRSSLLRLHGTIIRIQEEACFTSSESRLTPLERSVVVLEDRRFFEHQGYDVKSIAREILKFVLGKKSGGASTIDIQLFRTMSNRYERTLRRKIREAVGARALQYKCSKIQILRTYLDNAYFGTELIGKDAVSMTIFNKFGDDLDFEEASFIASLLVYPKPRIATANWEAKVRRRAQYGRFLLATTKKDFQ